MAVIQKHVHKLKRHKFKSGNVTYFCVLDCSYKVSPAFAIGKSTICNICGDTFIMNEYSVRLAKPHCSSCHKPKHPIQQSTIQPIRETASLLDRLHAISTPADQDDDEI